MILRILISLAMHRRCLSLLPPISVCLVLAATSAAQTNQVQTTASPTTGQPQYTLRARVPLTLLDVVVTDTKGRPVHGLKQSDFTVLEDNKEVKPNSFEEHRFDTAPSPTQTLTTQTLPPNAFTNAVAAPSNRPLNVLLLDSLNTPVQVQQIVQQEMLSFVKKMAPGTRMAVFSLLNSRLVILQGFTSDPELLNAAIINKKNTPQAANLEDIGQDPARNDDPPSDIACQVELEHTAARAETTMGVMRVLARYLAGMPGRKNLIWFSGSFPLIRDCAGPKGDHYDFTDAMQTATDLLARAHVAIYPVDGRALDALAGGRGNIHKQGDEHATMDQIAEQTGGKATYASNDLAGAVSDAVDSGSNFYALTYTPTNQTLDTRFRTISVKVDQPGLHLVYRPGYYASEPDVDTRGKKIETVTPMQSAMMRGALEPTQLLFRVKVVQSPGTEDALPAGNKPDAKLKPPYRHFTISYIIDVNNIDFTPSPDGNYRGDFEYGVNVYNADGDEIVNSASKEVNPILPPSVYQSMLKGGANAHQEIAVPATGDYFLRVGVHDLTSDHVGAIEIPVTSITQGAVPATAAVKQP
jgi:VWFA-related protein